MRCDETVERSNRRFAKLAGEIAGLLGDPSRVAPIQVAALLELTSSSESEPIVDRAIARLREAVLRRPDDAMLLNDLGIAYAIQSRSPHRATDLLQAIEFIGRAAEVDPGLREAAFNQALLLEMAGLREEAIDRWQSYLRLDSASSWGAEAQIRLGNLRPAASATNRTALDTVNVMIDAATLEAWSKRDPQALRAFVTERLLPAWAASILAVDSTAAALKLSSAHAAGKALAASQGDSTVLHMVDAIVHESGSHLESLARAHRAWGRGRASYRSSRFTEARSELLDVVSLTAGTATPLRWYAQVYLGVIAMYSSDYSGAAQLFDTVLDAADSGAYPNVVALARNCSGINAGRAGNLAAALSDYQIARDIFAALKENENQAFSESLAAEVYGLLGDVNTAFSWSIRALRTLPSFPAGVSRYNLLLIAGQRARDYGFVRSALAIHSEALRVAQRSGRPMDAVEALVWMASTEQATGEPALAMEHLQSARQRVHSVEDPVVAGQILARIDLAEADILRANDPVAAVERLNGAVSQLQRQNNPALLISAFERRSLANEEAGATDAAVRDLGQALELFEHSMRDISDAGLRAQVVEAGTRAYDRLITLDFERGDTVAALLALERSRGALAQDGRRRQNALSPTGRIERQGVERRIAARLGADEAVIAYAILPDIVVAWCMTQDTIVARRIDTTASGLLARVDRIESLLRWAADSSSAMSAGEELYSVLIQPFRENIGGRSRLTLIADKVLHRLPFAALRDSQTSEYLIESRTLRMAPDLETALAARASPGRATARALVVSASAFDRQLFPELSPLRQADAEASAVAALYSEPHVLAAGSAIADSLVAILPSSDVLHFAGHARFDPVRPDNSWLLLAPGGRNHPAGPLYARDVREMDLSGVDLVVLAACSTLSPRDTRAGGLAGLTRAFLRTGTKGVVGSIWEVRDDLTASLLTAFHSAYVEGRDPALALREAQLSLLRSPDSELRSPMAWSAFAYHGH
jgi:CHAT domain-containing protein